MASKKSDIHLVVTNAFADYKVGDVITDAATVDEIQNSEHQGNVVRKAAPIEAAD